MSSDLLSHNHSHSGSRSHSHTHGTVPHLREQSGTSRPPKRRLFIRLISDMHLAPVLSPQMTQRVGDTTPSISIAAEAVMASLQQTATDNKGTADDQTVLVLAGDIGDTSSDPYRRLLVVARAAYRTVLLVPGNHEYYTDGKRDMGVVKEQLARLCRDVGVHLLDNSDLILHGVRFVGSTCWPIIPEEQNKVLVRENYGLVTRMTKDCHRLDFADFKRLHDTDVRYLEETVRDSREPCVVITHYPPTSEMLDDRFEHSSQVALHYNAGLVNSVAKTGGMTPLWLCGHSHTSKRMWLRSMNTLLVANCVEGGQYDPNFVVELRTVA